MVESGGAIKHVIHVRHAIGVPSADILVESVGILEYAAHIGDIAGVPTADILVKGVGIVEHPAHIGDIAGVPSANVLIEGAGIFEHAAHIGDIAGVPSANVAVEGVGIVEHVAHIGDIAGVPTADILVEGAGAGEHPAHVSDIAGVPTADVLVEDLGIPEQAAHVRHAAGVPAANVLVEGVGIPKHVAHGRHARQIRRIGRCYGHIGTAIKGVSHRSPFPCSPLRHSQQFFGVPAAVEVDAGEAGFRPGVVLDADGIRARGAIVTGVITGHPGRFVRAVIITVHIVVVGFTWVSWDSKLGVRRRSRVIRLDGDHKVITWRCVGRRCGSQSSSQRYDQRKHHQEFIAFHLMLLFIWKGMGE